MERKNVSLMGDGVVTGGSYGKVSIMGSGKVLGEMDAEHLPILGSLVTENHIKVRVLSVSGDGNFKDVTAQEIGIMGNGKFTGRMETGKLTIAGNAEVAGDVKADEISIRGSLEAKNVESEELNCHGTFEVETLNANNIKIKLGSNCRAEEIGGGTIQVRYPRVRKILVDIGEILLFRKIKRAELKADTIEADRIELENTVASSVKGSNIVIGPGCKIRNLEYREHVYIDSSAVVEHYEKV